MVWQWHWCVPYSRISPNSTVHVQVYLYLISRNAISGMVPSPLLPPSTSFHARHAFLSWTLSTPHLNPITHNPQWPDPVESAQGGHDGCRKSHSCDRWPPTTLIMSIFWLKLRSDSSVCYLRHCLRSIWTLVRCHRSPSLSLSTPWISLRGRNERRV